MEEFEKRYGGVAVEREIQKYWEDQGIYEYRADRSRPLFSIDTPPPTVSGSLHIGHIFSYTQAEMIARFRRMQGYSVYYPFGFDDNGLPSERLVEKETGIRANETSRSAFCDRCIETVRKYEAEFVALWKSMGFSCDWKLQYSTVSRSAQRLSQRSFIELAAAGHAYIKESPVLWCTECRTSIAQAELDARSVDAFFHHVAFSVDGEVLEIATTRPELLYGVVCVLVNPDDPRYSGLIGRKAKVPLYDFEVPLLADDKVAADKGTGAVMCATFGDTTDVEWVSQYGLPYRKALLPDGSMAPEVPFVAGLGVKAAREEIVRLLKGRGLLVRSERITHAVSVHERCGAEVEIVPSRQWYIDVLGKKGELLEAGDRVRWYPAHMKSRYVNWVENLKWDWCISRQRYFGVPIPVWYCAKCARPAFADLSSLPVNPLETAYSGVCECGCTEFVPDSAVLDTWATSSISPMINLDKASEYGMGDGFMPMSMRTQAHEIIRTWAFYTIVKSLYHTGDIPWKDAMICGFVLAKPGEKISKSKGNADLTPQALIDSCSADAIRYWVAGARLGTDTFFDQGEMTELSGRFMTKLWNSSKFVCSHLGDFDPLREPAETKPIDRWIVERTNETIAQAAAFLGEYEAGLARKAIDELFWKDLCDNYIEIVKERLYQPDIYGAEARLSAQRSIYYCLLNVLKMYAVYVPHLTECIYRKGFDRLVGIDSIHLTQWERPAPADAELLAFGEELKAVVSEMRKHKSENGLSMRAEVPSVTIRGSARHEGWFRETEADLAACSHARELVYDLGS
ncbi:MAG: valine--tRNA ligase [Clostridiales Family XIII bacterium]|jgi:valyl-tRNA synthetase|nr:valine--tRNA ligase [Clostridiales Family XIII bacterium]